MKQAAFLTLTFLMMLISCSAQDNQTPRGKLIVDIGGGIIIGKATKLPKPIFPSSGCKCKLSKSNQIVVKFVVDTEGNVESAKAIEGHPFLRAISEAAIRNSKFSVSIVDYERVKSFGLISYEFALSKNKWKIRIIDYKLKLKEDEL